MCWPDDSEKERAFFGTYFAAALDQDPNLQPFRQHRLAPGEPSDLAAFHLQVRKRFGSWSAWHDLPRSGEVLSEFRECLAHGKRAGAMLCVAYLLQQHGKGEADISLKKLRDFLSRRDNGILKPHPSIDGLKTAWETHKPAAHLWAGLFFVEHWMGWQLAETAASKEPIERILASLDLEHLKRLAQPLGRVMLTMAMRLQAFGRTFTPLHAKQPLLDADPCWTLADLPTWDIHCPEVSLTAKQIALYETP
jgi:hypothetical protein